jgi:hypothetical protein
MFLCLIRPNFYQFRQKYVFLGDVEKTDMIQKNNPNTYTVNSRPQPNEVLNLPQWRSTDKVAGLIFGSLYF